MDGEKYLLVKGIAGLGNRILAALTGILYARLTGRILIIDWSDRTYSIDGTNAFPHLFHCPSCRSTEDIPKTDSVLPAVWRDHLHESVERLREPFGNNKEFRLMSSIDMDSLDYSEDVLVMWTYIDKVEELRKHFKTALSEFYQASRKEILSSLLREDLLLHPLIRERVEEIKNNLLIGKTVGVHVRFTDHRANLKSILKKLDVLLRQKPELQIFLATDNSMVKKLFEESYPSVITTEHWYPAPGSRIHQNPACPDRLENAVEALVDLYALAECDYLIVDTSSIFSYLAVLLSNSPDSNIFNVNPLERGGKNYTSSKRIIWRLMFRLGLFSWGMSLLTKFKKIQRQFDQ